MSRSGYAASSRTGSAWQSWGCSRCAGAGRPGAAHRQARPPLPTCPPRPPAAAAHKAARVKLRSATVRKDPMTDCHIGRKRQQLCNKLCTTKCAESPPTSPYVCAGRRRPEPPGGRRAQAQEAGGEAQARVCGGGSAALGQVGAGC